MEASGTFEVTLTTRQLQDNFDEDRFAQMGIDKTLKGDLVGTSKGEMLSIHGHTQGSAGYVAIEQVTGTLKGRKGNFELQHSCFMSKGSEEQNLRVVPDSATEELIGLTGNMKISIAEDNAHSYKFTYELPESLQKH